MRKSGKIACGALAVNVICGILGLVCLAVLGVNVITQPAALQPDARLFSVLYADVAIMGGSMIVMVIALTKRKK